MYLLPTLVSGQSADIGPNLEPIATFCKGSFKSGIYETNPSIISSIDSTIIIF